MSDTSIIFLQRCCSPYLIPVSTSRALTASGREEKPMSVVGPRFIHLFIPSFLSLLHCVSHSMCGLTNTRFWCHQHEALYNLRMLIGVSISNPSLTNGRFTCTHTLQACKSPCLTLLWSTCSFVLANNNTRCVCVCVCRWIVSDRPARARGGCTILGRHGEDHGMAYQACD